MFARRWPTKWDRNFRDPHARDVWKRDLEMLGVDSRALHYGLNDSTECARMEWPPSPGEFAALCRPTPQALGMMDTPHAYREATRAASDWYGHKWSHPAVYRAALEVGIYALRNHAERTTYPAFERAYAIMVRRALEGEPLDAPLPKGLPKTIHRKASPEKIAACLAKAREHLRGH